MLLQHMCFMGLGRLGGPHDAPARKSRRDRGSSRSMSRDARLRI